MHIVTVVGARPQFVKAAPLRRALVDAGIRETLVHTGQHYDPEMSAVFFEELDLPDPDANLGTGSGTHAVQTGETMIRLEALLMQGPLPDGLIVYGDTNSTLAGALVAAKLGIPLIHVEAGLRSFNRRMPEEINRVVTDRLSSVLCCPTATSVRNLAAEGIMEGVHLTGDVMLDATRFFAEAAERRAPLSSVTNHAEGVYYAATVHRAGNTDDPERLAGIFEGLGRLDAPVVVPLHPRTQDCLSGISVPENVEITEPLSYLRMLTLVRCARAVLTDSGGLQKEAIWLGVPCITLREETEWVETLEGGWNRLAGADPARIAEAALMRPATPVPEAEEPGAAARIAALISNR